jgi:hypothetical protein
MIVIEDLRVGLGVGRALDNELRWETLCQVMFLLGNNNQKQSVKVTSSKVLISRLTKYN